MNIAKVKNIEGISTGIMSEDKFAVFVDDLDNVIPLTVSVPNKEVKFGAGIIVTKEQLKEILSFLPLDEKFFQEVLLQKTEQDHFENVICEQLKPVGFEDATQEAKDYREELKDTKDIDQMTRLQEILEYKENGRIKLKELDEIFRDFEGGKMMNLETANEMIQKNGCHQLSAWNDETAPENKSRSDRGRIESSFGNYLGAIIPMLGFHGGIYWTSTLEGDVVICRSMSRTRPSDRMLSELDQECSLCGFENKE